MNRLSIAHKGQKYRLEIAVGRQTSSGESIRDNQGLHLGPGNNLTLYLPDLDTYHEYFVQIKVVTDGSGVKIPVELTLPGRPPQLRTFTTWGKKGFGYLSETVGFGAAREGIEKRPGASEATSA